LRRDANDGHRNPKNVEVFEAILLAISGSCEAVEEFGVPDIPLSCTLCRNTIEKQIVLGEIVECKHRINNLPVAFDSLL